MESNKIICANTDEHVRTCECEVHQHNHEKSDPHDSHAFHDHSSDCGCQHGHGGAAWVLWVPLGATIALMLTVSLATLPQPLYWTFVAAAWLAAAYDLALNMFRNVRKGSIFDENLLMVVASLGAIAIGEPIEGMAVVVLYQIGEWLQHRAVERSRGNIAAMLELRPETANLVRDGRVETVAVERLTVGDIVMVRAGERVPADCVVAEGTAGFDTSSLTGEGMPRDAREGDELLAGFIDLNGSVVCRVTRPAGDSAAARVAALLRETDKNKAPSEAFISRFARIYTPVVCALAVLICAIPTLLGADFSKQLHIALTFLVVSCPCALVLSVPLTFFAGIGGAARRGIMFKGGDVLETLAATNLAVALDKTGTLTEGRFEVDEVLPCHGVTPERLLSAAAFAERGSSHPLAAAIVRAAGDGGMAAQVEELAGYGVRAVDGDRMIVAGNARLMEREGIDHGDYNGAGSVVHVAENGEYLGVITVADSIKRTSTAAVEGLRRLGVGDIAMLTGDTAASAARIAETLGIDDRRAGLLPQDKLDELQQLRNRGNTVVFVGDGINDAPSLALADVGIAMADGRGGIAAEAADAVIMGGDPLRLVDAIRLSRKTRRVVRQNVVGALAFKAAVLALAVAGIANMWVAVIADVGVTLAAVLNALRIMRRR